ncbi:MAG: FIST N-terminal domain-containing protein [Thermodesulfobacteriota bacterium]
MKVGIGYSNEKDGVTAGRKTAEAAMISGGIERPAFVLAFCSGLHDPGEFFKGLQSALGTGVPIVGGSSVGIITNDHLSYDGFSAGAAVIESENFIGNVAAVGDLDQNEKAAGQKLAEKLSGRTDGKLLLIFYDSIKVPPTANNPPVMNASPGLIEGIENTLEDTVPIIGAGVIGDFEFNPTQQFCGSYVDSQSVVGALLSGDFRSHYRIMHGCIPKDGIYHTVTKVEGPVLYELDGKPIVEIIDAQYGTSAWRTQFPVKRLTIGVNHGDKFEEFNEKHFVNRLISGALPDGKGVLLFEPDLTEGDEILFMLRNNEMILESARKITSELLDEIVSNGEKPVWGLYIDCAGRAAKISDTLIEEASVVQNICNQYDLPLLGFYSGVEIAPLLGKSRGLDWTGVLLILAEG